MNLKIKVSLLATDHRHVRIDELPSNIPEAMNNALLLESDDPYLFSKNQNSDPQDIHRSLSTLSVDHEDASTSYGSDDKMDEDFLDLEDLQKWLDSPPWLANDPEPPKNNTIFADKDNNTALSATEDDMTELDFNAEVQKYLNDIDFSSEENLERLRTRARVRSLMSFWQSCPSSRTQVGWRETIFRIWRGAMELLSFTVSSVLTSQVP